MIFYLYNNNNNVLFSNFRIIHKCVCVGGWCEVSACVFVLVCVCVCVIILYICNNYKYLCMLVFVTSTESWALH